MSGHKIKDIAFLYWLLMPFICFITSNNKYHLLVTNTRRYSPHQASIFTEALGPLQRWTICLTVLRRAVEIKISWTVGMRFHWLILYCLFDNAQCQIKDLIWFVSMVLVGHGFIKCLALESLVVSISQETGNLREEILLFFVKQIIRNSVSSCIVKHIDNLHVEIWK